MFEDAIEKISESVRPVHTIMRKYGDNAIIPSASTLLFVNHEGYAITTKTFVESLVESGQIEKRYEEFKKERDLLNQDEQYEESLKNLEQKYDYQSETIIQVRSVFLDCVDTLSGYTCQKHPLYNLALIRFNDFNEIQYQNHAILAKYGNTVRPGKFLCRTGFPFAEFTNYRYNEETDSMEWTSDGKNGSPRFPREGMVTRFMADITGKYGIEMSTPSLNGEGGGPLFDERGIVYGLQYGIKRMDSSTLETGQCLHIDIIKNFLDYHSVKYFES